MPHVELLKPHIHAGVDHAPGAVIELDDDLARWLAGLGIARPVMDAAAKPHSKSEEKSK